jgi:hypothetical protein
VVLLIKKIYRGYHALSRAAKLYFDPAKPKSRDYFGNRQGHDTLSRQQSTGRRVIEDFPFAAPVGIQNKQSFYCGPP